MQIHSVIVRGKTVYFTFSDRFGPFLTDKDGEDLARQPVSDRHPFWEPFNAWLADWRKAHPKPKPEGPTPSPSDYLDRRGG
jgi:hypothetical protein